MSEETEGAIERGLSSLQLGLIVAGGVVLLAAISIAIFFIVKCKGSGAIQPEKVEKTADNPIQIIAAGSFTQEQANNLQRLLNYLSYSLYYYCYSSSVNMDNFTKDNIEIDKCYNYDSQIASELIVNTVKNTGNVNFKINVLGSFSNLLKTLNGTTVSNENKVNSIKSFNSLLDMLNNNTIGKTIKDNAIKSFDSLLNTLNNYTIDKTIKDNSIKSFNSLLNTLNNYTIGKTIKNNAIKSFDSLLNTLNNGAIGDEGRLNAMEHFNNLIKTLNDTTASNEDRVNAIKHFNSILGANESPDKTEFLTSYDDSSYDSSNSM